MLPLGVDRTVDEAGNWGCTKGKQLIHETKAWIYHTFQQPRSLQFMQSLHGLGNNSFQNTWYQFDSLSAIIRP